MTEDPKRHLLDLKAVALKYDPGSGGAPKVSAKGEGYLASKIMEIAKQHDIPIRKDRDLVQVLSRLDINQEIPPELYQAVAEILAFIYQSSSKAKDLKGD